MKRYAKTPTVYQMEMTECGAASLCMILAYYGRRIPLEIMRREAGVSRDGCNMLNIKRAAESFGLRATAYRKPAGSMRGINPPCVIHWNGDHFVVFEGYRFGRVYINDPAVGRRRLTEEEFEAGYSGVVMTFGKTEGFIENCGTRDEEARIAERLRGEWQVPARLLGFGLAFVLAGLAVLTLLCRMIDDVLCIGRRDVSLLLLVSLSGAMIVRTVLGWWIHVQCIRLRTRMTLHSSKELLEHIYRLPAGFFDQRYISDVAGRMTSAQEAAAFLSRDLVEILIAAVTVCAILLLLLLRWCSPLVLAAAALRTFADVLRAVSMSRDGGGDEMRLQISGSKLTGTVNAGFGMYETIQASGAEPAYYSRVLDQYAGHMQLIEQMRRRRMSVVCAAEAGSRMADLLLLIVGSMLVISGLLTTAGFASCAVLLAALGEPVDRLARAWCDSRRIAAHFRRVMDVEASAEVNRSGVRRDAGERLQGNLELRDVTAGFGPLQAAVIRNISMTIHSGESAAFVGPSGCGKSTILKAICGMYTPESGEILYDDMPADEIASEVFSNSVAIVSQDARLFAGSIRDNLTMWDPTILERDMVDAARDAGILEFICRQKDGFDTRLEEGAANLSGGERQRMEIARALAKRPSVLLLDEATSALDPIVEKQIMDNIRRRGCTCIIAAHRLSTVRDCSTIIVLDEGRIAEQGTHSALMKKDGMYAALMRSRG